MCSAQPRPFWSEATEACCCVCIHVCITSTPEGYRKRSPVSTKPKVCTKAWRCRIRPASAPCSYSSTRSSSVTGRLRNFGGNVCKLNGTSTSMLNTGRRGPDCCGFKGRLTKPGKLASGVMLLRSSCLPQAPTTTPAGLSKRFKMYSMSRRPAHPRRLMKCSQRSHRTKKQPKLPWLPILFLDPAFLPSRPGLEAMLMLFHPHSACTEPYTLGLQAQSLLEPILARQHDFSAGAHHTMPGQPARSAQRPHDLPRTPWKTGSARHFTISGHLTFRDGSNSVADRAQHCPPIAPGTRRGCGVNLAPA